MIKVIVEVREIEGAIAMEVYSEGHETSTERERVAGAPFFIAAETVLKMIHAKSDRSVAVEGESNAQGEISEGYKAACRRIEEQFKQRKKNNDPSNPANPN